MPVPPLTFSISSSKSVPISADVTEAAPAMSVRVTPLVAE